MRVTKGREESLTVRSFIVTDLAGNSRTYQVRSHAHLLVEVSRWLQTFAPCISLVDARSQQIESKDQWQKFIELLSQHECSDPIPLNAINYHTDMMDEMRAWPAREWAHVVETHETYGDTDALKRALAVAAAVISAEILRET